jgi:fumarate hydratase class II
MEGDDAMNGQEHPALRDIPIGIDSTGQRHETDSMGGIDERRFDGIVDPKKVVRHGVGGS